MNGSARTRYRMPGKPCPFRPYRHELDFLQCKQSWMVGHRWPWYDLASASMNVRVKQAAPFGNRQALRPSVANGRVRELEQQENGSSDADAGVSRWSVMPLRL